MQQRTQVVYILPPYMPFVGPRMYRDAVCPETFAVQRHLQHIRHITAARIAQRCYLVYVYAQFSHNSTVCSGQKYK